MTNREEGFVISSSILAKSKFYGNSTSAILDGIATLSFLPRGEDYKLTMPYAHCKGILMGTMTLELGGKVYIECSKTGYSAEMEFKLRVCLGFYVIKVEFYSSNIISLYFNIGALISIHLMTAFLLAIAIPWRRGIY